MVSAVPIIPMASSILLQILAAYKQGREIMTRIKSAPFQECHYIIKHPVCTCPVPTWPQYTTLAPIQVRSSLAALNSSSGPPTMNVSLPELAAPTPEKKN